MRKARVLFVDDNPLVLASVQRILESNGYVAVPAEKGETALALMREPFDVAILDYELPDTDGIRLAKCLHDLQPQLPVILFSGRDDPPTDGAHEITAVVSKGDPMFRLLAVLSDMIPEGGRISTFS